MTQVGCFEDLSRVGILVDGKCVVCKNSSRRCIHRSHYEKMKGEEVLEEGMFQFVLAMTMLCLPLEDLQ